MKLIICKSERQTPTIMARAHIVTLPLTHEAPSADNEPTLPVASPPPTASPPGGLPLPGDESSPPVFTKHPLLTKYDYVMFDTGYTSRLVVHYLMRGCEFDLQVEPTSEWRHKDKPDERKNLVLNAATLETGVPPTRKRMRASATMSMIVSIPPCLSTMHYGAMASISAVVVRIVSR